LKITYLQVREKTWRENIFKWYKNLGVDLSSAHWIIKLGQVKENNIQVWFGIWDGELGLPSHVKNEFANSLLYLFTLSTLIILLVIIFIWINLYFLKKISETPKSPFIVTLILERHNDLGVKGKITISLL
jgi:hypothetical protein